MDAKLKRCYERWYKLKDHPEQLRLLKENKRFPVVPAGRRCLEAGTLVSTPQGPIPIEQLKIGDSVWGFDGDAPKVTTVSETHDNGLQEVIPLLSSGKKYLAATKDHKLWGCNETDFDKRRQHIKKGYARLAVGEITRRNRIKRIYDSDFIMSGKHVKYTYALGAFIGDGCSTLSKSTDNRQQRFLYISACNDKIPCYLSGLLNCSYRKLHKNNFTYALEVGLGAVDVIPFYGEWCSMRRAHEKTACWDQVDTWDKERALNFLSGIIDTDGSIHYKSKKKSEAVISISMQAEDVIYVCQKIILKYFQEELTIHVDRRDKYINGDVFNIKTSSNCQVIRILKEIDQYLVLRKGFDCSNLNIRNVRPDRIGFTKGEPYMARTYDITVSNDTNLYILHKGGIVTSNSGKTERAKRKVAKMALENPGEHYFLAAPTRDQVKKIFWNDIKLLTFAPMLPKSSVRESEMQIVLPNDTKITLVGLDKPERMEGTVWSGGVIDEIANVKPEAWAENISPALDTFNPTRPHYKAWCWLIGVPEGLNHYYELAQYAKNSNDPEWGYYTWLSADILPVETIEAAKRRLSAKQFRQEYEASFEFATGRIYEDYSKDNLTNETIQTNEQLHWMHDFNYTPMSSAIGVIRKGGLFLLDEIILTSAVARQTAIEFCERYKNHANRKLILYGDPAGKAGEKHGQISNYVEIENVLKANNWHLTRKVKAAAPAIKDRQNAVRAKIKNAAGDVSLFVNPSKAVYCDKGLSTAQFKKGSTFQEDETEYQHITTAIGYCVDYNWPVNFKKDKVHIDTQSRTNYW